MSTPEDMLGLDDAEIDRLAIEMHGLEPDGADRERHWRELEDYYTGINRKLAPAGLDVGMQYIRLRTRTARLGRLMALDAPETVIASAWRMVRRSLTEIDPRWETDTWPNV